jgi:hypothetical protein
VFDLRLQLLVGGKTGAAGTDHARLSDALDDLLRSHVHGQFCYYRYRAADRRESLRGDLEMGKQPVKVGAVRLDGLL